MKKTCIIIFLFFHLLGLIISGPIKEVELLDEDIHYLGINIHDYIFLDIEFSCPLGMEYNSFLIMDEKIAIIDTVPKSYEEEWLKKISDLLYNKFEKYPDYFIIQSLEPDQIGCLESLMKKYPEMKLVSSSQTFQISENYFGTDFKDKRIIVNEGETLSLGSHTLMFVDAPLLRYPGGILTYEKKSKVLFSSKFFGNFGGAGIHDKWESEARRYYYALLAKYNKQAHLLTEKVGVLNIKMICPFYGPLLDGDVSQYIKLYDTWTNNIPQEDGIVIAYTADHGDLKPAMEKLAEILRGLGKKVILYNLSYMYVDYVVADTFRYSKLVIATTSFNNEISAHLRNYISHLTERNYQSRVVGLIDSGTWSSYIRPLIKKRLSKFPNIKYCDPIEIITSVNDDTINKLNKFAKSLVDTQL